jgi:sec-independent protein translocase protein TatA
MHLGAGEIALLIVLALVLFGAKRLPQVGRAAGEAIREFKSAFNGVGKLKDDEGTTTREPNNGEGNGNKPE